MEQKVTYTGLAIFGAFGSIREILNMMVILVPIYTLVSWYSGNTLRISYKRALLSNGILVIFTVVINIIFINMSANYKGAERYI